MANPQATVGASLYSAGVALALAGAGSIPTAAPTPALLAGAAVAGAIAGVAVAQTRIDRRVLVSVADRDVGAYLTLAGFGVLLAGFVAVLFSELPLAATAGVLVGGAVASAGGDLFYGAANRVRMDDALGSTDVAIPIGRPLTRWFVTAARVTGLVLFGILLGAGYLALQSGDGAILAMLALLGASLLPELLVPGRTGARTPGFGSERYLVEDGVLGWHGLTPWDEFEEWDQDDGRLVLRRGGWFSGTTEVAPGSEADFDRARSLVSEHVARRPD